MCRMNPLTIASLFFTLASALSAGNGTGDADLKLNGFGSLGAVYNGDEDYLYRSRITSLNGSDGNLDLKSESLLGLQADYRISDLFSVGVQGIIRLGDDSDPDEEGKLVPSVEWAYLKYAPSSRLEFRAGRLRLPAFYCSESFNVGYSYAWVRLPQELYGQVPFNYYDGVDFSFRDVYGDYFYRFQGMYGNSKAELKLQDDASFEGEFNNIWGLVFSGGTNALQLRLNYLRGAVAPTESPYTPLLDAMAMTPYASLARAITFRDKTASYYSLGLNYTAGSFESMGEISRVYGGSALQQYDSWFLHAGYRIGEFLPYLTYGSTRLIKDDALYPNPIPDQGELALLRETLDRLLKMSDVSRTSWSLGARDDINEHMALKFQYDRISLEGRENGFIVSRSPGGDGNLDVFSAALHFVY